MYDVQNLDLTTATGAQGLPLVDRGQRFTELFMLALDAGASFELKVGTSPWFRIPAPFTMRPTNDDDRTSGVRWRNLVAQPGVASPQIVIGGGDLGTVAL